MVATNYKIEISTGHQRLSVIYKHDLIKQYKVSTAINGTGQQTGSECTPLGRHIIRAKIGQNMPVNTVFVARRPTGEIYNADLDALYPERDWILTRILWLSGLEPGYNRLGNMDTMRRYIYIHGCPETHTIGQPGSHGCIKLYNDDIIELFELVPLYTEVVVK